MGFAFTLLCECPLGTREKCHVCTNTCLDAYGKWNILSLPTTTFHFNEIFYLNSLGKHETKIWLDVCVCVCVCVEAFSYLDPHFSC